MWLRKGRHRLADHGKKRNTAKPSVFRLFVPDRPAIGSLSRPRGRRERERERDGTAIERPPLRFARGIGSSKKEPGGPDRRARRRAPSYQTFEPTSSSLSPPLSSTALPRRRDLETSRRRSSNSDFAARLFLPLRGGSSVARYRCRPPSNAFPFLPSAPVNWSPGVYKTPSRLRALGGPPCAAARIESRTK